MVDTHDIELPVFEHWSTADTTDDTIGDRWAEIRRHSYTDVATDPVLPGFYGDVALGRYTNFTLSTKRANAEDARRSATRIAQGHDADEYLFATFQIRGSCLIEQADHTHLAAPGSLFIYDSSLPFRMRADGPYEQVVVQVGADRAFALAGMDRTTDILATPMECSGVLSAVSAFFTQLAHYQADDPVAAARLEPHAASLAVSLLRLTSPLRPPAEIPALLRRDQVLAYIHAHLTDPDLDADRIADAVRLSRRSLYRLFHDTDYTLMDYLRRARVEAAQNLLRNHPTKSISHISREAGFNDERSFYRTFRTITGMTPNDYREQFH